VRGANCDLLHAEWTVRRAHGREKHPQIIRDIGHRPDGGARVGADCFLINRHDRRKAVDEIDVGLFQLTDETLRKRGHGCQQPSLSFGIDGVEGQRRFSRTAHARDDNELVPRNLEADVLQVVFPGSLNLDCGSHWI
jgi:hypothetical protein